MATHVLKRKSVNQQYKFDIVGNKYEINCIKRNIYNQNLLNSVYRYAHK